MVKAISVFGLAMLAFVAFGTGESMAQEQILDQAVSWWDWLVDSVVDAAGAVTDWVWDIYEDWT